MPFWLKRITVCFRLLPFTTLTMIQLSFLLSICYPSRLSGSDFQSFPHCPVGSTHSITGNKCHSRVTPNGGSGISAIQDMTFLSQRRRRHVPLLLLTRIRKIRSSCVLSNPCKHRCADSERHFDVYAGQ